MSRMRLRSRFLLLRLAIAAALTASVILVLRYEFLRESTQQAAEELQECAHRAAALRWGEAGPRSSAPGSDAAWVENLKTLCSCDVAVMRNGDLQASTLGQDRQSELARELSEAGRNRVSTLKVNGQNFVAVRDEARPNPAASVVIFLKSLRGAEQQLFRFTRLMAFLAAGAMAVGFLLVVRLSDTFARPLGNLVEAVHALEKGDFSYPVVVHSGDELAEVTQAFDHMRSSLRETQRQLLRNERLATIGQMASSISHDMRYPLTTVFANAEFLSEEELTLEQRQNLYQEIRTAIEQINDLIESLLEFSRGRDAPRRVDVNLEDVVERAVYSVRSRPEFQAADVQVFCPAGLQCRADPMKLERALRNLLVNACEAAGGPSGTIVISVAATDSGVQIRVADNGPGVPEELRATLFQPFVSHGKAAGVGLGLAIVQKICQDHGGEATLESTAAGRTVFLMTIPPCLYNGEESPAQ